MHSIPIIVCLLAVVPTLSFNRNFRFPSNVLNKASFSQVAMAPIRYEYGGVFTPKPSLSTETNTHENYEGRTIQQPTFTADETDGYPLIYDRVYTFGEKGQTDKRDNKNLKFLLGGKGANLADMCAIGLSVPAGFTVTTEVCAAYNKLNKKFPTGTWFEIIKAMGSIEESMNRKFGDADKPLLVSVRSGAAVSMPGMMDTVLNLGLNDVTVKGLARDFGERFALDSYRRFLNMFGCVVFNIPHDDFENVLHTVKEKACVEEDSKLSIDDLNIIIKEYKKVYTKHNHVFLNDPYEQLYAATTAVFDSWMSDRAIKYREAESITGLLGTAVNIQAMVFGNMGDTSGTGVCFTRDPNTGAKLLYGEYLINAQGEDVVAGIRTPQPIKTLKDTLPIAYAELLKNVEILESYYHDMQDIEFTIQEGKLFMLQTRSGKRSGMAATKIAVDFVSERRATVHQALMTVKPEHLNQLLHPQFAISNESPEYISKLVAKGLPASPGAAVGVIVFSPEQAEARFAKGESCVLVRTDTSPEDVGGMWASQGILTARGGMTSHAAVVARGWGKPCICGCGDMKVNSEDNTVTFYRNGKEVTMKEGDYISLNGDTGDVMIGSVELAPPSLEGSEATTTFMKWVDETKSIKVLANADSPIDAREARRNGAQGIGLTRTEHMFFSDERIRIMRRMILSKEPASRERALKELIEYQRSDFEGIFEAMDGLPVTVRLLDPPLHEFLPSVESIDEAFARDVGMTVDECRYNIEKMAEVNPMLGLRGCRLGVMMPDLIAMQTRAIVEAALNNKYRKGLNPRPEIMVPLVGSASEFTDQMNIIKSTMAAVFEERANSQQIDMKIGTMIEVPRAALTAAEIAEAGAEFFSFGTNDLTQMTFGFSRDDIGSYLPTYLKKGLLVEDPFEVIDEKGVGQLIKMSAQAGRYVAAVKASKNNLDPYTPPVEFKAGICGEHGGDPQSVRFFVRSGLNYVSCSPLRVPIARLAAAQCVVEDKQKEIEESIRKAKEMPSKAYLDLDAGEDNKKFIVSRSVLSKTLKTLSCLK